MTAGVDAGAKELEKWVDQVAKAVSDEDDPAAIRRKLDDLEGALPLDDFAELVRQQLLHGLMLGALDSQWEAENDEEIQLEAFRAVRFRGEEQFTQSPFAKALELFRSRAILTPEAFAQLEAGAAARAFTIAGLASQEFLGVAHAELTRQIRESAESTYKDPVTGEWIYKGPNFREFKTTVRERLETAGWTPANPSHIETIYRTNIASAYSSGRHAEMTQPETLKARPYWQIRGVKDSRQRKTHRAAHGIVLPADHPFWTKAFPPFGYACRCRAISRTEGWVKRHDARIGPEPPDLPDPGFDSGTGRLLAT